MSGEEISRINSTYKKSRRNAAERTCSFCCGSKQHADRKECPAWNAKWPCGIPHYCKHLCKRKGVPPTKKTGPRKPTNKADTSGTEDNQVEPTNRLTVPAELMFNIGQKVTKRYSREGLANCSLIHKNLPRPAHGTKVTPSQEIKSRDVFFPWN